MATTDYNKLKVTELKEILKERGIPSTGLSRKAQIVEALETYDSEQQAGEDGPAEEVQVEEGNAEDAAGAETKEPEDATEDAPTTEQAGETAEVVAQAEQEPPPTEQEMDTSVPQESEPERSEPLVLENNEPLSKEPSALTTPQRPSPAAESVSSDTRKRKRRSPTPPLSEESVNKKLKAAEEEPIVKLPEDQMEVEKEEKMVENAPVAVERTAESNDAEKVLPYATSDDMMEVEKKDALAQSPVKDIAAARSLSRERTTDSTQAPQPAQDDAKEDDTTAPALHPATRALYIRNLVRPLQSSQLRSHLVNLATAPHTSPSDSIIQNLHIDTIRTHAFAVFTSVSAAARARSALHSRTWPDDPTRKPLWVDFVPEDKVDEWIEIELKDEREVGRRGGKRWEVVYEDGADGIEATLSEASTAMPAAPARQGSSSSGVGGGGMGMPNALGPRGDRPQPPPPSNPSLSKPSLTPAAPANNSSFDVLDQRFSHTTTKPKLYYLPLQPDLVQKRLDALAAITSRHWDGEKEGSFSASGDVRRYTFEDVDRVVDGGPDIGNFGRPRGMELPAGGRRGGGGGGGRGRR